MNAYEQPERLAFLLRLWKARDDGEYWRASLEDVKTGEKRGFTSTEDLFTFLRQTMQLEPPDAGIPAHPEGNKNQQGSG